MPEFDTIIKNGTVIDGLRSGRFSADLAVKDGYIAQIARGIPSSSASKVLDATGLIVAPGFIDLHTHYDSQVYWDPWCTISGWHGVTSVAIGNCGFGFAPCKPEHRDRSMLTMSRNEAVPLETMKAGMPWDWETYPEFLDSIDRTPKGVNMLSYAPLSPLMAYVMGFEKGRPATDSERAEMCRLLDEAMEAGACGWSAQWGGYNSVQRDYDGTPMMTDIMSEEDIYAFAGVLRKAGRGFVQAIGAGFDRYEKISEISGRPIIYNVLTLGADQHGVSADAPYRKVLDWIEDANMRGHRIFAQAITTRTQTEFTLVDWNLFDGSPIWRVVTLGSREERMAKMSDPTFREALKEEYDRLTAGSRSQRTAFLGISSLEVHFVEREDLKKDFEGYRIREIAKRDNKHVIDAFLDLALADNLDTTFATPETDYDPEQMRDLVNSPYAIPGISDGGAHTKFLTLGAYPTDFIATIVREQELLTLEQAHWALSALPAMAAGFRDRGFLREGMPADVVVYDFEQLKKGPQEKAWDYPANEWRQIRKAEGYRWILVNGDVTFEEGECTGATPGKLLRHGSASGR